MFLSGVNIRPSKRIYIRSVKFIAEKKHAIASCVSVREDRKYMITSPQWRYFDNDWWQIDD